MFSEGFFSHEAHLSTEQDQAQPYARFPRAHGEPWWPPHLEASPRQGPRAPDELSQRTQAAPTTRSSARFAPRQRLTRGAEFEAVFKAGRRSADPLFTVLYLRSANHQARLGMTASAKRIRTAVARNRIRRVIRESFRHATARLQGLDIVVIVKESARTATRAEMFASLAAHWQRLERHTRSAAG